MSAPTLPRRTGLSLPRFSVHWTIVSAWVVILVAGGLGLVSGIARGPEWATRVGATAVFAALAWGLTIRSGRRSPLFAALAAVVGAVVVVVDQPLLNTAASVMAASVAALLAVMSTVPATTYLRTLWELAVALGVSLLGALAALGFHPSISVTRYQLIVLLIATVGAFVLVYQLGAGFHGLGRRGTVFALCGGVLLAISLVYATLLRSYSSVAGVTEFQEFTDFLQEHLNGYPRPALALVGVPALVLGVHMRSRRRQGWWVTAFGVAFTAPVTTTLVDTTVSVADAMIDIGYSLVLGVLIGWLLIKVDLTFTGPPRRSKGKRAAGRRAAAPATAAVAVRPEPARTKPLL